MPTLTSAHRVDAFLSFERRGFDGLWVCDPYAKRNGHTITSVILQQLVFTGTTPKTFILELKFGEETIIPEGAFPASYFDLSRRSLSNIPNDVGKFQRTILRPISKPPETIQMRVHGPFDTAAIVGLIAYNPD